MYVLGRSHVSTRIVRATPGGQAAHLEQNNEEKSKEKNDENAERKKKERKSVGKDAT